MPGFFLPATPATRIAYAVDFETAILAFLSGFEKISGPWTELIGFYRRVSDARMKYDLLLAGFPRVPEASAPVPQPELA